MMRKFEKVRMCLELKTKYVTLKKNIWEKYVITYKNIPSITSLTFNTLDEIIKAYQLKIWGVWYGSCKKYNWNSIIN